MSVAALGGVKAKNWEAEGPVGLLLQARPLEGGIVEVCVWSENKLRSRVRISQAACRAWALDMLGAAGEGETPTLN